MELFIKNFQSIKSLDFKFKGFTIVTGNSSVGKSSMVRALDYWMSNNPNKTYIRHGAKELSISVDGNTRIKSSKKNEYVIDGNVYSKVGQEVPIPILDMGYKPFEFDGGSDNTIVIPQYKPLFIVNETDYVQTKIFQAIFKTSKYDDAVKLMLSDSANLTKKHNSLTQSLNEVNTEIDSNLKELNILENLYSSMKIVNDLKEFTKVSNYNTTLFEDKSHHQKIVDKSSEIMELMNSKMDLNIILSLSSESISLGEEKDKLEKGISLNSKICEAVSTLKNITEYKEEQEKYQENTKDKTITLHRVETLSEIVPKIEIMNVIKEYGDTHKNGKDNIIKRDNLSKQGVLYRLIIILTSYKLLHKSNISAEIRKTETLEDLKNIKSKMDNITIDKCPLCGSIKEQCNENSHS